MKEQTKERNGITLIALVITIIVLLILAGVTIATLTGDNGLLQKAQNAGAESKNAEIEEKIRLACSEFRVSTLNQIKITDEEQRSQLQNMLRTILGQDLNDLNGIKVEKSPNNKFWNIVNTGITYPDKVISFTMAEDDIKRVERPKKAPANYPTSVYGNLEGDTLHLSAHGGQNTDYPNYSILQTDGNGNFSVRSSYSSSISNIKNIVIDEMISPNTLNFAGCTNLENITNIINLDTSRMTGFSDMFRECSKLEIIDVSGFDTSGITLNNIHAFHDMFNGCRSVKELDLSGFDTSKGAGFHNMFSNCISLTKLDLRSFDTSRATIMEFMFSGCTSLKEINLNFNTENVTDMMSMFYNCPSLTKLDLSSFNTNKVTTMRQMFQRCSGLLELDISGFNVENTSDLDQMFSGVNTEIQIKATDATATKILNVPSNKSITKEKNFI